MNLRLLTLIGLMLGSGLSLRAQNAEDPGAIQRSPEELRDLLAPIALYPDPLISLILPASTAPSDVVLAARFVRSGADLDEVQDKSWEPSVKALTRYPDTLSWMDENLEWTTQVGDAFVSQPVDVMDAVQELRAKARAMGNLVDTPQQNIVQDDEAIRILPAQPEYIYEPRYDPQVVYYERPVAAPLVYFGAPFLIGSWLRYDCDWNRHRVYRGEWHDGWDYRRDYDRRKSEGIHINNRLANVVPWHVDTKRRPEVRRPVDRPSSSKPSGSVKPSVIRPSSIVDHVKKKVGDVRRAEPVIGSGKPVMGSGRPGERGGKGKFPIPSTPAPMVKGDGKPHSDSKGEKHGDSPKPKGFTEFVKPKTDKPMPHIEGSKSKPEVSKPKGDSPKPKFDAPKPKGDSPKPKFDAPKPKFDSPRPKGDSPKPKFDSPKPKMEAPKPKPKFDAPKPRFEAPKPQPKPQPQSRPQSDNSRDKKKDKDKKN